MIHCELSQALLRGHGFDLMARSLMALIALAGSIVARAQAVAVPPALPVILAINGPIGNAGGLGAGGGVANVAVIGDLDGDSVLDLIVGNPLAV